MGLWATWSSGRCPCPQQGGLNEMNYKVPSNPNLSIILFCDYFWKDWVPGAATESAVHHTMNEQRCLNCCPSPNWRACIQCWDPAWNWYSVTEAKVQEDFISVSEIRGYWGRRKTWDKIWKTKLHWPRNVYKAFLWCYRCLLNALCFTKWEED